jgi:hypothetical protein
MLSLRRFGLYFIISSFRCDCPGKQRQQAARGQASVWDRVVVRSWISSLQKQEISYTNPSGRILDYFTHNISICQYKTLLD